MNRTFGRLVLIWVYLKKKVKGIFSIFKDKNYLGWERFSKKEAYKHLRKARVIIMRVASLHNSYPRRVIPADRRVWLERVYLLGICPFCRKRSGASLNISLSSGCCWIKCHFCMSICFRLGTVGQKTRSGYLLCISVKGQAFCPQVGSLRVVS